jgi:cytochrome c peroxidase
MASTLIRCIMKNVHTLLLLSVLLIGISSCRKVDIDDDYLTTPYALKIPADFPPMAIPADNPMTVEGVQLGRRLYYDDLLSTNGRSCSSCHLQELGFSHPMAGPGGFGIMAHINIGWNTAFGWHGGESLLDHVPLADLAEGNAFLEANNDSIRVRLSRNADYKTRFKQAFGVDIVALDVAQRQEYIAKALGQFIRTQISGNSRFDQFMRSDPNSNFSAAEFRGYQLFFTEKGDCFHCHPYPMMTDGNLYNNGLDGSHNGINIGQFNVTNDSNDIGKFRVPTLRNIGLSAPYMHDNRFATLEEVVGYYNAGVQHSATLAPIMTKPGGHLDLQLTPDEVADLVAFLHSLTDTSFTNNPELRSPF